MPCLRPSRETDSQIRPGRLMSEMCLISALHDCSCTAGNTLPFRPEVARNIAFTSNKAPQRAFATPKLYCCSFSPQAISATKHPNHPEKALTNSKTLVEPLDTFQTDPAVNRETATSSRELGSPRRFPDHRLYRAETEPQAKTVAPAAIRPEFRSRSESGTLWIRPWGGK